MKALLLLLALAGLVSAEPERIPVWPGNEAPDGEGGSTPATTTLTLHRAEKPNGAAAIICPGGGYGALVTEGEGHGIARWLNTQGITGLVLEYRLPQGKRMVPLLDAQRAIRLARSHAKEWQIDPERLGIIGFSAGGHLASTAATRFDGGKAGDKDPVERFGSRPDFAILVYPVITMTELTHGGSRTNLLGPEPSKELMEEFSSDQRVTAQTPPTFLAHAKDDTAVVPRNSELFAAALKKHRVAVEYLELPDGGHGLNGYKGPSWDAWQAASLKWLDGLGMMKVKTAASSKVVAATDPQVLAGISPLNWIRTAEGIHSPVCGADFKLAFVGTKRVVLNVDTSRLNYPASARFPILAWSVNKGELQTHQLAAGEREIVLADGVANPVIDFYIKGLSPFEDRFHGEVPVNAVSITGFTVAAGCRVTVPPVAPLWLNLGDSILSGDGAAYAKDQGRPADDQWAASDDARASYGYLLAKHYGYRESRLAFGGYAWGGGGGNNPDVAGLVDRITSTSSRLTDGRLVPCPQVVLVNLGENGAPKSETVVAALGKLRERTSPQTKIVVMVPVSGRARNEVSGAVKSYVDGNKDAGVHLIDLGAVKFDTADGQHPTAAGHEAIYKAALPFFDKLLK
ncbi:prolyl oligopeptidase family serine peptidase [Luteolibacter sp. GHJ8]|uniref:Prolyl oligopeptidase family serine peptidase n=1 Tax=Luteolibacter rhizosphaerae TaxID=2989719 RepID=A0ABT3G8K6_9BACT|nr:prolyl oligopeptidase family serine peptidase [Luteolibacter rhizosphaerae]MCW1915826.1 prolyl oligopeptidase family serine peptidase [Luteolibacter rhizosphaerae]